MGKLYLLIGDRYRVEKKSKDLIHQTGVDEFNIVTYDIDEVDLSVALTDAQTIPFMSDEKVVVIKNHAFDVKEFLYTDFLELIEEMPNFLTLIIIPNKEMDKRSKLYKRITANGELYEFSELEADKLENACVSFLDKRQIRIAEDALQELIKRTEGQTHLLMNELQKLENFAEPNDTVFLEDIEDLVTRNVEHDVFELVNAVVDRNITKAYDTMNDLLRSEDALRLLQLLIFKFRELNYTKTLMSKGYSDDDLMKFFKASKGRVYYMKKNAASLSPSYLEKKLDQLSDAELSIKKGLLDKRVALEFFLLNI